MQISAVSNPAASSNAQPAAAHGKNAPASQTPTDTVELSPAAQAQLAGAGDVDHDGDSH